MTIPENELTQPPVVNLADQAVDVEPDATTVNELPADAVTSELVHNPADTSVVETEVEVQVVPPRKQDSEFAESPLGDAKDEMNPVGIQLPTDFAAEQDEALNRIPEPQHVTTPSDRAWAQVAVDSREFSTHDDVVRNAIEREGSQWRQTVETSGGALAGVYARFKQQAGDLVSGDPAVMQLMQHRKLGAIYRIPLWNTGIWLTFKAPSETSLLELHRVLTQDKVDLGRRSYGLSYSHTTAIYMDRVSAFALEHVHSTNLKLEQGVLLRDVISAHDLTAVVIGLASTIWPTGFNYARSCIADPEKCRNVVEEKISIPKTLLVDRSSLTNWQLAHMSKVQANSVTLDDVKRYKEEMLRSQKRLIQIDKDMPNEVSFLLKVPTLSEYVEAGWRWINELTSMVDRSLNKDVSNDERNTHIIRYGQSSAMRQFGHWVEEIGFSGKKVADRDTVESSLATLSSDNVVRIAFQKHIAEYQSSSTITVAAIPSFKCPACGQVNDSSKHHPTITDAIPYDVFQTFFVALVQKIQSISER